MDKNKKRPTKSIKDSEVVMRQLVMPNHTNPHNTIFGGIVMSWIDMAAAMVAERHTQSPVVTVHIDDISFKAPIKVGDHVLIKAAINYVGKTSILIGVKVLSEDPFTQKTVHTTTAYLIFVAIDKNGKPKVVPGIIPSGNEELRRFQEGKLRMEMLKNKAL